jgi:hypothetical protein
MKKALAIVGFVIGLYFAVRAASEPFLIDLSDPPVTPTTGVGLVST